MKTRRGKWINLFMLVSGCILLLTVVVPHHHHEDGTPCIFFWENENATDEGDGETEEHNSCECNGHTVAFNSTSLSSKHASETHDNLSLILFPLCTLFDYINPSLPFPGDKASKAEKALYAESLYSVWAPDASGLRAPPLC
jgi:hypothetical protein